MTAAANIPLRRSDRFPWGAFGAEAGVGSESGGLQSVQQPERKQEKVTFDTGGCYSCLGVSCGHGGSLNACGFSPFL